MLATAAPHTVQACQADVEVSRLASGHMLYSGQHAQQLLRLSRGLHALPIHAHSCFDTSMMIRSLSQQRNVTFLEPIHRVNLN